MKILWSIGSLRRFYIIVLNPKILKIGTDAQKEIISSWFYLHRRANKQEYVPSKSIHLAIRNTYANRRMFVPKGIGFNPSIKHWKPNW